MFQVLILLVLTLPSPVHTDIDECLDNALDVFTAALCNSSMRCANTEGGYECVCSPGTLLVDGVCQVGESRNVCI